MITKLTQLISLLFRSFRGSNRPAHEGSEGQAGQRVISGKNGEILYDSWSKQERSLEQIINEGSHGAVEKIEETAVEKSQAELDYHLMTSKFDVKRDLIVMSPDRLSDILELGYAYPLKDGETIGMLYEHILLMDGVRNIGIVKG